MRRWFWPEALLACVFAAAYTADSPRSTVGQSTSGQELEQAPRQAESTRPPAYPQLRFDPSWVVDARGFGPIRVGMSVEEVALALGGAVDIPTDASGCRYLIPRGWPEGVEVMIVNGSVARLDVRNGEVATAKGARIGSTEREVHALYRGQVEVQPHKYTEGHYMVVTPVGPVGAEHRIIFETDGETVEQYRAGALPAVEWVEGCA